MAWTTSKMTSDATQLPSKSPAQTPAAAPKRKPAPGRSMPPRRMASATSSSKAVISRPMKAWWSAMPGTA